MYPSPLKKIEIQHVQLNWLDFATNTHSSMACASNSVQTIAYCNKSIIVISNYNYNKSYCNKSIISKLKVKVSFNFHSWKQFKAHGCSKWRPLRIRIFWSKGEVREKDCKNGLHSCKSSFLLQLLLIVRRNSEPCSKHFKDFMLKTFFPAPSAEP